MQQTEQFIESLAKGAGSVKPASPPAALCARWMLAAAAYIAIMSHFLTLRVDLAEKLHAPLFLAEVLSLAAIIITASLCAALLSFPDAYQKRRLLLLPALSVKVFIVTVLLEWRADSPPSPPPAHELECLTCITLLAFLPAGVLFWHLHKMASTSRSLAGGMAALSAFAIGALTLRLAEDTDSITHLVQWHYLPMFGFCAIGALLGKKILKW